MLFIIVMMHRGDIITGAKFCRRPWHCLPVWRIIMMLLLRAGSYITGFGRIGFFTI
jgi:hypothetical protein